ncbi:MAG: hypothetical protein H6713_05205 [Myxococcales bacterium]|nr:hypothetical protein [Myxococcales bacterium]MCB9749392.1 hypothetical protein [Myxococcales bacterium]
MTTDGATSDTGECVGATASLTRPADPIVLRGADLSDADWGGLAPQPGDIVAFRYEGGWQQIPVQIDERDTVSFSDVYNVQNNFDWAREDYTDAGTFTGPDADPTFDDNDELVLMARDAGDEACAAAPAPDGVTPGSGVELRVTDPLDQGEGFVYLFVQEGGLDPAAGAAYVTYSFNLLSGAYKATYDTLDGPNPENTTIETDAYTRRFADRWITDALHITAGDASGVDILDRHKAQFPGTCVRSEDTFSNAEGAFVVNRVGPIRALRSYVGANSGPLTQRTHLFYDRREDVITDLRVHGIPGIMDFYDYGPMAAGMTYTSELEGGGETIDGAPDTPAAGLPTWELVSGDQGSLTHVSWVEASFNVAGLGHWYLDDTTPNGVAQCTGDTWAYGQHGLLISGNIPNTDPLMQAAQTFAGHRVLYYDAPGLDDAGASQRHDWVHTPPTVEAVAWP